MSFVDMEPRKSTQQIGSGLVLALFLAAVSLFTLPVTAAGPDGAVALTGEPSEVCSGIGFDTDFDEDDKLPASSPVTRQSIHPDRYTLRGGPDAGPRRIFSRHQARAPPRLLS